ncbi:MAG: hydrogenase iron-sulfur subunit [Desulfobacteraceae bacterium]|nr:hydrogenase iron-sulfur subunit [Desulfobacteraceae bacterium]
MNLGIYFSKCEGFVGTSIDLDALAKQYSNYTSVKIFESFYNGEDFNTLLNDVERYNLDSLILAGDSYLTYKHTRNGGHIFKCLSQKGINRNRIELVNLRNMVAIPHQATQEELQMKAKLLTDVAIERVKWSGKVNAVEIAPRKSVAIIGANLSSIAASQILLDEGYKVFMVDKNNRINMLHDEWIYIRPTYIYVTDHPRFSIFYEASVKDFYGFTGDYTLNIATDDNEHELHIGAVILSPADDSGLVKTAQIKFHVDVDENGSLAPRDEISARSHTEQRGIFIINSDWYENRNMAHKFVVADAAAASVINLLNKKEIFHRVTVSQVRTELCSGCGACVKTCIFNAVSLQGDPLVSVIDPRRCRGCGNCVTVCPADARDLSTCPSKYLFEAVNILSKFKPRGNAPLMLLLACNGCGYQALDEASQTGVTWPVGVMPLWVVCGGQVDMQLIMHAFVKGFDGVIMLVCGEGCCHNMSGNLELERRINLFREILISRGIDHEKMHVVTTCSRQGGEACVESINQIYGQVANKK